jgi:hypothetical protein
MDGSEPENQLREPRNEGPRGVLQPARLMRQTSSYGELAPTVVKCTSAQSHFAGNRP